VINRHDIIACARRLVENRVLYLHGGRSWTNGVDCIGMLALVADQLNYPYSDLSTGYSRRPDGLLLSRMLQAVDAVSITDALPGDIPVFWFDRETKYPQHVAIYNETMGIIHCHSRAKRVVETSLEVGWARRLLAVLRFRGVGEWQP